MYLYYIIMYYYYYISITILLILICVYYYMCTRGRDVSWLGASSGLDAEELADGGPPMKGSLQGPVGRALYAQYAYTMHEYYI